LQKPQSKWLPLRQAVFRFGIGPDSGHPQTEFFSYAAFLESKNSPGPQREALSVTARSLQDLAEILREKSGADFVEINQTATEPNFVFTWRDGLCIGGSPWAILAEPIVDRAPPAKMPPNMRLATAKEQALWSGRCEAVRAATSLVWHQFMVRHFSRVVSAGAAVLYARPQTLTADFAPLPPMCGPSLRWLIGKTEWRSRLTRRRTGRSMP
jgi:hypothetical protein